MKEGGTSLNKTFREYNLVFKGLRLENTSAIMDLLTPEQDCRMYNIHLCWYLSHLFSWFRMPASYTDEVNWNSLQVLAETTNACNCKKKVVTLAKYLVITVARPSLLCKQVTDYTKD